MNRFFVTTSPGLEKLLEAELKGLGLNAELEPSGVVAFEGEWYDACRVLLESRVGSRVMMSLRRFSAKTSAMLYDQVRRIEWTKLFTSSQSIAVFAHGDIKETNYALSFAPLKIKDAICDEFRKFNEERPNVNRAEPDVRLEAFIHAGRCELSVDITGEPLHKRGYRLKGSDAPLRESRAAGLLAFAGYDGSQNFVDPFCGSGTIAIEAAMIAKKMAPGLLRPPKAWVLLKLFKEAEPSFHRAYEEAKSRVIESKVKIRASDTNHKTLALARDNALRAKVKDAIEFKVLDAKALVAPDSMIACNPPYGERLGAEEEAMELIQAFTRQAKHHSANSSLTFVLPRGPLEKSIGFKPARKLPIENGPIPSVFLHFELYSGTKKQNIWPDR